MNNDDLYKVWFASLNMKYEFKRRLLENLESEEAVYMHLLGDDNYIGIATRSYNSAKEHMDLEKHKETLKKMDKIGAKIISCYEKDFPQQLNNFKDSPSNLFYIGDISNINNTSASIVGSRKNSDYGRRVTGEIVDELVKSGINIVSGLATGIDELAHRYAIKFGGYTVGVIGCGIDKIYPVSNEYLYKALYKKGLVISEFYPGTPPLKFNFPARNKVIARISDGIIVIEAAEKSGSLITVTHGLDSGREIIAVPNPITSNNSRGVNRLIYDGAIPYVDRNTLKDVFCIDNKKMLRLTNVEERILGVLSNNPMHIDDLTSIVKVDIPGIYNVLFELQAKKLVTVIGNSYYIKNN
ncbi:DNA protecting protein DprA [Clostridium bornimense]|uniref:DNA protecting protein DprA n=1 Tax=Clostridium bornimense TaxID=1216932 RepID=W6RZ36_9CLOT|nr:DNA-processing protein DprA [Clostridium bornimense]CDM68879.1 DNA protecting protein DprA [Clostridium bornimense]